jgi:hypothetical protein
VFLPPSLSKKGGFAGLGIWVCWRPPAQNYFFLVEDFPRKDEPARGWSGNTVFSFLLQELGEQLKVVGIGMNLGTQESWKFEVPEDKYSVLQQDDSLADDLRAGGVPLEDDLVITTCGQRANGGRYTACSGSRRYDIYTRSVGSVPPATEFKVGRDQFTELCARFAASPFALLREWNAEIAAERSIDVLFRIRHSLIEASVPKSFGTCLGYPIAIAEHPSHVKLA